MARFFTYAGGLAVTCGVCAAAAGIAWQATPLPTSIHTHLAPAVRAHLAPTAIAPVHPATREGHGPVLNAPDEIAFREAWQAADRHDWDFVTLRASQIQDDVARDLLTWRRLQSLPVAFEEIEAFRLRHKLWIGTPSILAAAERNMPASLAADQVIAWYEQREPITSEGRLRLGEALSAAGYADEGLAHIRRAWSHGALSPSEETRIFVRHGAGLTAADHRARMEQRLTAGDVAGATRAASFLDAVAKASLDVRLKMLRSPKSARKLLSRLPKAVRKDHGVAFYYARMLRRNGAEIAALKEMEAASPAGFRVPDRWWREKQDMVRAALRAGQAGLAYKIASEHGLLEGPALADAEFLSGWISLRFLEKPAVALSHFRKALASVNRPISVAKANYWIGRAQTALGHIDRAQTAYIAAAAHGETYYGQLAQTQIAFAPIKTSVPSNTETQPAPEDAIAAENVRRAIEILHAVADKPALQRLVLGVASQLNQAAQYRLLLNAVSMTGDRVLTLRVAKQASYKGLVFPSELHPLIDIPRDENAPDLALVLALIRQESEFDSKAVSTAGARGLMQLMPASARGTAALHGISHSEGALISDPQYNLRLGQLHLDGELKRFGNSYILAAAAYNAGPGNVRKWLRASSDAHMADIDVIDWVELIPYDETRNYVQRVMEAANVYRKRLNQAAAPADTLANLGRSEPAQVFSPNFEDEILTTARRKHSGDRADVTLAKENANRT